MLSNCYRNGIPSQASNIELNFTLSIYKWRMNSNLECKASLSPSLSKAFLILTGPTSCAFILPTKWAEMCEEFHLYI